jgi:hypothetical protein
MRRRLVWILALAQLSIGAAALAEAGSRRDHGTQRPQVGSTQGPQVGSTQRPQVGSTSWVLRWNRIAIDASGADHAGLGEQLGPGRSSRAMAIVHIAVFDALNAATGGAYRSYTGLGRVYGEPSLKAAIAQAAHDTLASLFPSQAATFDAALAEDLAKVRDRRAKYEGVKLGQRAAAAILALRASDGSQHDEPAMGSDYVPGDQPGFWRMDPISQIPVALGAHWGEVAPFVLESTDQFRTPPPPALTSPEYTAAYNEVTALGGDGVSTPTLRSEEQTFIGTFWAYDGTPSLCAPPRLYNQIAVAIAQQRGSDLMQTARLLALVNTAMADAGTAAWDSKYHYALWRPVTGVRESDPGTGPTGLGDGNPDTLGDPNFSPLGAPASNLSAVNFTPPFPAYPSGHATFGGALFQTLRRFYRTDDIAFTFVSDEFNGVTVDNEGNVRPLLPRSFTSLSQAEEENGQSRIYLGIHWSFDKTAGIAQGNAIADWVFEHAFQPARRRR